MKLDIKFNHLEDDKPVEIKVKKGKEVITLDVSNFLDLEREVNIAIFYKEDVELALESQDAPTEALEDEKYISFLTYKYYSKRQEAQESWFESVRVVIDEYPYEKWKEGE